jgi:hypothetical protein
MVRHRQIWVVVGLLGLAAPAAAQSGGQVQCEVTENGAAASGTITLLRGSERVAEGSCGKSVQVAAGSYTAVLALDGALDGPEQRQTIEVAAGATATAKADFATGLLAVRIQRQGRRAAGMAIIRKAGKQVGTLGSGVSAHLGVGQYEVIVRYRDQERRFEGVEVKAGQTVNLDASFE